MPINITVTNSGKIALPELKKMVFTLAALRLNSKVCPFSLGLSRRIHAAPWLGNSKLNGHNMKSR